MVLNVIPCLKKILGQARIRFGELLTMLKEIDVCNRLITYIYCDIIEILSPNHFIHGRAIGTRCEDIVDMKETDVSVENLN